VLPGRSFIETESSAVGVLAAEDANIGYGYLTWLAAKPSGYCQPFTLWPAITRLT
jgi:hypothetical protein